MFFMSDQSLFFHIFILSYNSHIILSLNESFSLLFALSSPPGILVSTLYKCVFSLFFRIDSPIYLIITLVISREKEREKGERHIKTLSLFSKSRYKPSWIIMICIGIKYSLPEVILFSLCTS